MAQRASQEWLSRLAKSEELAIVRGLGSLAFVRSKVVRSKKLCDRIVEIANEIAQPKLELKYKKGRVAVSEPGSFFNVFVSFPKKAFVGIWFALQDPEKWVTQLTDAGLEAELTKRGTQVLLRLRTADFEQHQALLRDIIHQVVREQAEA